jgi:hypothetical protein
MGRVRAQANVLWGAGKVSIAMHVYRLERRQHIARGIEEVFAFFADAQNLASLTPDFLHFHILTPQPLVMQVGTLLDYQLRLFGIPFRWRTRIDTFDPPYRFADVQLRGPYRLWHHTHVFQSVPGGTCMLDRVDYALPFALLGAIAHGMFVRRTLQKIFDYRARQLGTFFPPLA